MTGAAFVVDPDGHVAAAKGISAPDRVQLPADLTVGEVLLPHLGRAVVDALPGGWLLRLSGDGARAATALVLDLPWHPRGARRRTGWRLEAPPDTAAHGDPGGVGRGRSRGAYGCRLADDLFADRERVVTVRAEVSRLRRVLGSVLLTQPYRLSPQVSTTMRLPDDPAALLPGSSAPAVLALRP